MFRETILSKRVCESCENLIPYLPLQQPRQVHRRLHQGAVPQLNAKNSTEIISASARVALALSLFVQGRLLAPTYCRMAELLRASGDGSCRVARPNLWRGV